MPVRIVRLGSPRAEGEGTRVGTVRRPPRGVPKSEFASKDWYDDLEGTMSLTEQQRKFYESTLAVTRQEMDDLDRMIEEELAKVKDGLAELQNASRLPARCTKQLVYGSGSRTISKPKRTGPGKMVLEKSRVMTDFRIPAITWPRERSLD